jgi:hypothetical protein
MWAVPLDEPPRPGETFVLNSRETFVLNVLWIFHLLREFVACIWEISSLATTSGL